MVKLSPSPEACRASDEADERRKAALPAILPREMDGRQGLEPTRYGDWEHKGIVSDF